MKYAYVNVQIAVNFLKKPACQQIPGAFLKK